MNVVSDVKPGQGYVLRGDNRALISAPEHECVLAGPSDTGKSMVACIKLHLLALRYPGCQLAMVRNTAASIAGTVALTFKKVVAGTRGAPIAMGGTNPNKFVYASGSVIWLGGLDRPEKVLSSERDAIYVCQAEQIKLEAWEFLSRTCSGRGAIVKTPQLFADANPAGSRHWIKQRAAEGKLRLLRSTHKDNPTLYDNAGELLSDEACAALRLPSARLRMQALMDLTGVRRKRLYEGIWATSEGAVYDMFDSAIHVCERPRSEMQRFYLALDDGFTNPAVILDIGSDSDGRWHIFREFYKSGWVQDDVAAEAARWAAERQVDLAAVDEAAAGLIEALTRKGVNAEAGKGRIFDGISLIQARLKVQNDGKPRLTVDPSCVETINEFESYVWKPEKDIPVDDFNHSLGAIRYLADALNEPTGAWDSAILAGASVGSNATTLGLPGVRHFTPRRL